MTLNLPVDYYIESYKPIRKVSPQTIGLAQNACMFLDIEAGKPGAWGPECKIAKFITMPEGQLEKWYNPKARPGDYMYTPPRIGTDTLRFILENGAGRRVDVTIKLRASSYQGGALDNPTKPILAESQQRIKNEGHP